MFWTFGNWRWANKAQGMILVKGKYGPLTNRYVDIFAGDHDHRDDQVVREARRQPQAEKEAHDHDAV